MQKTFFLLLLALPMLLKAQSDPPLVASGTYDNDVYKWTFVVGDLAILTLQDDANLWSQGSVQPNLSIVPVYQAELPDVSVLLYPNPTADVLFYEVSSATPIKNLQMDILDVTGRVIYHYTGTIINGGKEGISLIALPAGAYFIRLTDAQGRLLTQPFQKI